MNHRPQMPDEADFPRTGTASEKLQFALHYAVLAPSVRNTQPWQFAVQGDRVDVFADRSRALPVADPHHRELIMSCGAALEHLVVALRHFGHRPEVRHFPDPAREDLLAQVRLGPEEEPGTEDALLFYALHRRATHRKTFRKRRIAADLLPDFVLSCATAETWLTMVDEPDKREAMATLIAEADKHQGSNPQFRAELAQWLTGPGTSREDGIPGHVRGLGLIGGLIEQLLLKTFDLGQRRAVVDRKLASEAPLLVVLGTRDDTPSSWLQAGRSLARLLLRARATGVFASFFSQPVQVPAIREKLGMLAGNHGHPQLVLRMGYGTPDRTLTPRRATDTVVRTAAELSRET